MISITKPTLILNEQICRQNIKNMRDKAVRNNVDFRPHFKTHQSLEVGRWFKALSVEKITVSSLEMAKYFADDGWQDITVAFPINLLEIATINDLSSRIKLNLLVESISTVRELHKSVGLKLDLYIKIDTGYGRTGVSSKEISKIEEIIREITKSNHLNFAGFLDHAGHSYDCENNSEIIAVHKESVSELLHLKSYFIKAYPNLKLSTGDTPTCSVVEDFSDVDEIRPGNFVFYDLTQAAISSCNYNQIAVAMACPIVAIHEDRNEIIIYGGGSHFSKDFIEDPILGKLYGIIVESKGMTWGEKIPNVILRKLSQEHGTIEATKEYIQSKSLGDIVYILPVHSCMTALAMREYISTDAKRIDHL